MWGLFVVASAGIVVAAFVAPYLPTHDGPQHLYLAHVGKHYSDPGSLYAEVYRPTSAMTALGFSLVYGPLLEVLSWRRALQTTLAIIALAWSWGFVALVRAVRPERTIVGILGFATAFQWAMYMGFFSYVLSLSLTFCCAALAIRRAEWSPKGRLLITGLLALQGVAHIFGAHITSLFLIVLVLARHRVREWPRQLALLAPMGLPVALLTLQAAGYLGESTPLRPQPPDTPIRFWEQLLLVRGLFAGGPFWRGWVPVLMACGALGLFLSRSIPRSRDERAVAVVALLLLLAGVLCPVHLPQWEYFSPRFLAPGVMLALPLLPLERLGLRSSRVGRGALAVFACASVAWSIEFNRDSFRKCADVFDGLGAPVRRQGFRLPLALRSVCDAAELDTQASAFPFVRRAANLGTVYAAAHGGLVPYAFAMIPQLHGFVIRDEVKARLPPVPPRALFWSVFENPRTKLPPPDRWAITVQLAEDGAAYEDVLLHGDETEERVFLALGYRPQYQQGRMSILRFQGCSLEVGLSSAGRPRHATLIEHAWVPGERIHVHPAVPPQTYDDLGRARASIHGLPCGDTRVRAFIDTDGSGTFSPGESLCAAAGPDGWASVRVTPAGGSVNCQLGAVPAAPAH